MTPATPACRDIQEGINALRRAQQDIQQARESIMTAVENTDTRVGKEAERLIALINDFWENRVIP